MPFNLLSLPSLMTLIILFAQRDFQCTFVDSDLSRAAEISSLIEPITIFSDIIICWYFFYYFPPLPALAMEIRVWIFSSRLSASDCRKEKKENKSRQQNLSTRLIVVCMLDCRALYSSISFFQFSCFVILISGWWWCCRCYQCVCVCMRNCFVEAYCCFFPSLAIVWSHECVGVFIIFSSFLPFVASLLFCSTLREAGKHINVGSGACVCVLGSKKKRKHKEKLCKNVINNTQCCFCWIQMRNWSRFFGGLLYCYSGFVAMIVVWGLDLFPSPFCLLWVWFSFFGRKTMGNDTHISINEKQNRPENVE